MARSHFDIEKPRKIYIAIQGYDGQAQIKALHKRRAGERAREQKKAADAQRTSTPSVIENTTVTEAKANAHFEQLAAAERPLSGTDTMSDLMAAFDLPLGQTVEMKAGE
ncbi:MAG: hypothetical protein KKA05_12220 [Alphaproteobacteria bacterium]|nr:hypothetical protein [Alphaproteobacteria bacterium]